MFYIYLGASMLLICEIKNKDVEYREIDNHDDRSLGILINILFLIVMRYKLKFGVQIFNLNFLKIILF